MPPLTEMAASSPPTSPAYRITTEAPIENPMATIRR